MASTPLLRSAGGQRAGVAVDGVDKLLGLLARGVAGSASAPFSSVEHPLDQLHRNLAVEPVQLPPVAFASERRGQRLTAGEDERLLVTSSRLPGDALIELDLRVCRSGLIPS